MKYKYTVIIAFAVLLLFLGSFFIPALRMESSENRTMATFDMVLHPEEGSVVYHDSPVERLDAALSDQFPFREFVVKRYLSIFNGSENMASGIARVFMKQEDHQYALRTIGKYALIENTGYLMEQPSAEPMDEDLVQRHVDQLEYLHNAYPDLKIYVYYVTQASDTSWFDHYLGVQTADHYQQIRDAIPAYVKSAHLVYQDLEDYMNLHYKTDHHWNHKGARKGYEDIYNMMREDFEMGKLRAPTAEIKSSQLYDYVYLGSYGRALGELYTDGYDAFSFYEYDLPARETAVLNPETKAEIPVARIGLYYEYKNGSMNKAVGGDHYITMYGTAADRNGNAYGDGKYVFIMRNSAGNGKNLLIVGDSYNRAFRDVLAAHFDTTVSIDYRILSKLPIDYVIERYDIDALLISSHTSMWNEKEYFFTFGGNE